MGVNGCPYTPLWLHGLGTWALAKPPDMLLSMVSTGADVGTSHTGADGKTFTPMTPAETTHLRGIER
jgi:hypothetical protein